MVRHSLRARLGDAEAIFEFSDRARSKAAPGTSLLRFRPNECGMRWGPSDTVRLAASLEADLAGLIDFWRQSDLQLSHNHGCRLPKRVAIRQSGRAGARIFRPAASLPHDEDDEILLSVGLLACLDDLIGSAMCAAQFMREGTREGVTVAPRVIMLVGDRPRPHHFHDYSALFVAPHAVEQGDIITGIPLDRERLAEAELVTSLAATFVYRHEQSHALFGHLELLRQRQASLGPLALGDGADAVEVSGAGISVDERRCLELQADSLGIELLLLEELVRPGRRPSSIQLHKLAKAATTPSTSDPYCLQFDTDAEIVRACVLSAACAITVIDRAERARSDSGQHPRSADYPLPATRLLNVMLTGSAMTDDILRHLATLRGEEPDISAIHKTIVDAMTYVIVDLQALALACGIRAGPFGELSDAGTIDLEIPIARDFLALLDKNKWSELNELATDAGREFLSLHPLSTRLFQELRPLMKGGPLTDRTEQS